MKGVIRLGGEDDAVLAGGLVDDDDGDASLEILGGADSGDVDAVGREGVTQDFFLLAKHETGLISYNSDINTARSENSLRVVVLKYQI